MRRSIVCFGSALFLAIATPQTQAHPKKEPLVIKKVEEYASHQVSEGLAIGVQAFASDALCNTVFEYKDIVSKGILPVLVVVENRGTQTIQIFGKDVFLTVDDGSERRLAPMELRQVIGILEKKKGKSIPLPFPTGIGSGGVSNSKMDQIRSTLFEMKLIPPSQSDYGFVYFEILRKQVLKDLKNIYLPEIKNVETGEPLIFFEIGLPSKETVQPSAHDSSEPSLWAHALKPFPRLPDMRFWVQTTAPAVHTEPVRGGVSPQDSEGPVTIPKKSEIVMSLLSFVTTRTAAPGDKFYGQVAIPVVVDDRILIPVNSYVVGTVLRAQRAGRLRGKAELELDFQSVIFPDGKTRSIEARVRSAEGYKSQDVQETEGTIKADSQKGKDAEQAAKDVTLGASLGSIVVGASARNVKGFAYGGVGGAVAGLGLTLLRRGDDVELQKGTHLTLVLDQDIELVRP